VQIVETDVPARLDRLPWGRFHTLVVIALGVTWILDGLEVTLAGSLAGAFKHSLHFTDAEVGMAGSAYLTGAVLGAIFFGWLTDRLGRKKLFFTTIAVYLVATAATATSWNVATFALFRFFTGAGIGGEYAAINSAIQELTPARVRGWTDLIINGSFWMGAAIGAASSIVLLDPAIISPDIGWRLAFLIGAALALSIFLMRFWIPESPRWLMTRGRVKDAEAIVAGIDEQLRRRGHDLPPANLPRMRLRIRGHTSLAEVAQTLFREHRRRTLVGLSLMAAQAFFYNAIFFTYALILTDFYGVPSNRVGWHILPFAAGNFLGPVLLGRLFDTIGRKPMITFTYATSGVGWTVIFFFASSAASSAYLTVSETFPLEIRALAIAIFYAIGTGVGGIVGPFFFGELIQSGSRVSVFIGYLSGSVLMILAALIAGRWAVAAERKPLETVAPPLASVD
jgi:MFS family permease